LFTHALQVTERNFVAHTNLGFHLESQGRLDEAISHYLQAVRIAPQFETAVRNLFNAQARKARQQSSDRRTE
jgi:protein O-GlcNAc transferase